MSKTQSAVASFFQWTTDYRGLLLMDRDENQLLKLRGLLPGILEDLARHAESLGIDSTPVWAAWSEQSHVWETSRWDELMDGAWFVAKRLQSRQDEPDGTADTDTTNATQKTTLEKNRKKRPMNAAAADCARRYREQKGLFPMNSVIEQYIEETKRGKFSSIMRILNDNPDQWKLDE